MFRREFIRRIAFAALACGVLGREPVRWHSVQDEVERPLKIEVRPYGSSEWVALDDLDVRTGGFARARFVDAETGAEQVQVFADPDRLNVLAAVYQATEPA